MDEFILVELIQLRVDPVATELLRQREHAIQVFRAVMAVADEYSNGLRGPELMLMLDQREVRLVTTTSSRSGRGAVHQPDAGTAASRRGAGAQWHGAQVRAAPGGAISVPARVVIE